ncbi:hypothetical protein CRG98_049970, partial [Punica granatum]
GGPDSGTPSSTSNGNSFSSSKDTAPSSETLNLPDPLPQLASDLPQPGTLSSSDNRPSRAALDPLQEPPGSLESPRQPDEPPEPPCSFSQISSSLPDLAAQLGPVAQPVASSGSAHVQQPSGSHQAAAQHTAATQFGPAGPFDPIQPSPPPPDLGPSWPGPTRPAF